MRNPRGRSLDIYDWYNFFRKGIVMERRDFLTGTLSVIFCSGLGCVKEEAGDVATKNDPVYRCPVCEKVMAKDAYCVQCNAVAAVEGTVHCDKCEMDKKIGTYCGKCNRFMFDDEIRCEKADKTIIKGTFCAKKKVYRRLPTVGYCETCQKPFDKITGCPVCNQ